MRTYRFIDARNATGFARGSSGSRASRRWFTVTAKTADMSSVVRSIRKRLVERHAGVLTGPARPSVLVVDDEDSIRIFTSRVLSSAGYDVTVASDGPEALKIVERHRFDVFVLDVMMPMMRGDELARRLRLSDRDARVLYLTGFSDQLFKEKVTLWEHEAFVDKPVTVEGLLQAVSLLAYGHTHGPAR